MQDRQRSKEAEKRQELEQTLQKIRIDWEVPRMTGSLGGVVAQVLAVCFFCLLLLSVQEEGVLGQDITGDVESIAGFVEDTSAEGSKNRTEMKYGGSAAGGTYRDAAISGTRDTSNAASHGKITEDADAVRRTAKAKLPGEPLNHYDDFKRKAGVGVHETGNSDDEDNMVDIPGIGKVSRSEASKSSFAKASPPPAQAYVQPSTSVETISQLSPSPTASDPGSEIATAIPKQKKMTKMTPTLVDPNSTTALERSLVTIIVDAALPP